MNVRQDRRRLLVARMLTIQGVLLLVVAVIHLIMTPEIARIVGHNTSARAYAFLWPPYALDHVAVGVLLVPLGISAMLCAGGIRAGERRAWWIAFVDALSVLALSPAIALTVGLRYFVDAPAFLVAAAILAVLGVWMVLPLLWIRARIFA
jgi:hypothetical protein